MSSEYEAAAEIREPLYRIDETLTGIWKELPDLRDWFAMAALAGDVADGNVPDAGLAASHAYRFADAMMAARKEKVS